MSRRTLLLLASLLVAAPEVSAQSASIAGAWRAEVPATVKDENGVQTVLSTMTVTLMLDVRGDSVHGTLTRGAAGVARPVRGSVRGAQVVLNAETKAKVMFNGDEQTLDLLTVFKLTLEGDTMRGTNETIIDPATKPALMLPGVERPPAPVTLTRVKA